MVAWIVVFIIWLRTLLKYCKAYRDYEQSCRQNNQDPVKTFEAVCKVNKCDGVLLQFCRRFGLLLNNLGVFLGKPYLLLGKSEYQVQPWPN